MSTICHIQFQWKVTEHFWNWILKNVEWSYKNRSWKKVFRNKNIWRHFLLFNYMKLATVKIWEQWNKLSLTCSSLSVPFWWKNCFEKTVLKNFPASQTNSAYKHCQLGSQITEPISMCSQRDSRENHHGWLHIRQQVVYGLSIRHESFTSGKDEKPYFLRHHFISLRIFFRWKFMLRPNPH